MRSLKIDGLAKYYGRGIAVEDVTLDLPEGSFTTLLGPSGCGKTTTLRCLAGLEVPDAGTIRFGDEVFVDVEKGIYLAPNKRKLGMVFQSYALWPNKTVLGNVTYPLRLRGIRAAAARARALEALAAVGLEGFGERYPHELSGGQQQRVALARGLVSASGLLLFDEPLSNLDAKLRLSMREEIRRLHDEFGYSSVYVTHDQEEALAVSDTIIVMNKGRVQQVGTPQEIFGRPKTAWVAEFVGFDNLFTVASVDGGTIAFSKGGSIEGPVDAPKPERGADFGFRSDEVILASEARAGEQYYRFSGKVTVSSYLGDAYRLHVEIAPQTTMIVTLHDSSRVHTPDRYLGDVLELAVPVTSTIAIG